MKKLQGNPWGKLLAVLLLLVTAFSAGHFAVKGILNIPYVITGDWQQTSQFYNLLWERQEQLARFAAWICSWRGSCPLQISSRKCRLCHS